MSLPRLVVTGSSGFVGRHLLDALKERYRIFGLARRSQARSGAPVHPNIEWFQADIADRAALEPIFARIRAEGGAEVLIHLAAHYDFTGEESPEYFRTNVQGLRNVLDLCAGLGLKRFLFSSSLAACRFPPPGGALDEASAPDGEHVYARTKALGEAMLRERLGEVPGVILRFAALFSDWCEYPPLFMFLQTWLSQAWNRNLLGGRGLSAIPYLHVHDLASFVSTLLYRLNDVAPGEVLIASPDGAVNHRDLFEQATLLYYGQRRKPLLMPRLLCGPGVVARDLVGRLLGDRPFERPWMTRYIDLAMTVDAHRTREKLGWAPRPRLEVLRRLPFLIENLKTNPAQWNARNREAMKEVRLRRNLVIHRLLERHEDAIIAEFSRVLHSGEGRAAFPSYQGLGPGEEEWNHRLVLRHLKNAVMTAEKAVFTAYCRDLAERRFRQGYGADEVCGVLEELNRICFKRLRQDPESIGLRRDIQDHITMTLRCGCDQAQDVFEALLAERQNQENGAGVS